MKKMMKLLTVVAAAAMGLTACQNSFEEVTNEDIKSSVVINFISDEARTSVDTSGDTPLFSWSENEEFAVLEQTETLAEATSVEYSKVDEKAYIDATFNINPGKAEYKYVAVYPKAAFDSATSLSEAVLTLPAEQNAAANSYDPNADLMVSMPVVTEAQPTEAQPLRFTRLAAIAKMTIKNLPEGEQVEKVIFTADGKTLAGSISANLEDPHAFTKNEGGSSTVSVATTSTDVYFTVLPETLEAGDSYSVVVLTNEHLFVKQGEIAEGKSLVFQAGMVTLFSVNLENIEPSEKWVLVRDASTLEAGDVVTIAASDLNMVLSCYNAANYPYPSTNTDIVKLGDYLYHPIVTAASDYKKMVQPLVLSKRDANKVAFDFYNGVDYDGDTKSGYFTNTGTANQLKLQNYPSNNTLFYITIDSESGVASVVASDSENNQKLLKYYDDYTDRFGCVSEALHDAAKHHDVCIYKWVGKKLTVPTADAVITVPDTEEKADYVVVPVGGVAEATTFDGVEFTYIGDWAIEVSSSAEWLKLNYADGVLTYTADANPEGVRYATVTIRATHDGEDAQVLTFNVVQKGAPIKATVAEFIKMAVDPNVEYEVTGILSQRPSSASGNAKIKDINGNEATFAYVYMPNNTTSLYANNEIQLNDVVTIVAAVSGAKTGGSSSAHAICKGYYNFSATAENDLVGYEGGSVKLTLTKGGDLEPAGDISCSVVGSGAEVAYTTNAMEATLTFEANDGAPRQAVVTFTDTYASASVTVVQSADTTKGNTWELVTDASTLEANDQVIIAAKDYDVAMSTTISSDRRSAVAVTKLGNYYITPTADVQTLVLANGSSEGTFAFYDAVNKGFLLLNKTSSYYLKNQAYVNADTSFAISIEDGVATIGDTDYKIYYREPTSNYFYSGSSAKQSVCLYRLVGVKGEIPVIPADVTVPTKSVVVPEQATTEATPIDTVEFNYVGDWNISAVAADNWISFEFDKAQNKLTYTALKNDSSARDTTVTITASMEGQPSKTWTFKVLQKGKPMVITCDALNDKEQNVDVSYQLTGRIVSIPSSASGDFILDDGSGRQAKVSYLYTEDDSKAMYNNGLAVGDVVTVTTIVYTKGKGGNTNYHSTYKGHYRLTATADTNLVAYSGGTATFAISAESSSPEFAPAGGVIKGSLVEGNDFVTFDYTDNATTATATFAANAGAPRNAEFNFTYGLTSVSVTVGQENNPAVKVGWYLVTNVNELAVGDKVIIAAKSIDGTKDYAVKKYTSSNPSTTPAIEVELQGNALANVEGVEQYTLEVGHADYSGTWAFKCDSYSRYLNITSGSLKLASSLAREGSWTIDIASDGKTTLVSKTTNTKTTVMFNDASATKSFTSNTPSTTGKGAIYIYKYYNQQ